MFMHGRADQVIGDRDDASRGFPHVRRAHGAENPVRLLVRRRPQRVPLTNRVPERVALGRALRAEEERTPWVKRGHLAVDAALVVVFESDRIPIREPGVSRHVLLRLGDLSGVMAVDRLDVLPFGDGSGLALAHVQGLGLDDGSAGQRVKLARENLILRVRLRLAHFGVVGFASRVGILAAGV